LPETPPRSATAAAQAAACEGHPLSVNDTIDGVQVEMTRPVATDLDQHLVRAWLRLRISARISHPSGPWQLP